MLVELLARDPGLDGGVEILGVDAQDPVHLRHVDADAARQRRDMALERGAGAEGDDRRLVLGAKLDDRGDLLGGLRRRRRRRAHAAGDRIRPCRAGRRPPPRSTAGRRAAGAARRATTDRAVRGEGGGCGHDGGRNLNGESDGASITPAPARRNADRDRCDAGHVPVAFAAVISRRKARPAAFVAFPDSVAAVIEQPPAAHYVSCNRAAGSGGRDGAGGGHARRQIRPRQGRVYLTGTQALVRLPMMQRQRDAAAGLNTGCFISGLSRLAAGRARPGAVGRAPLYRKQPHPLPAGDQRRARRDRGLGQPAARPVSRRQIRRRLRHVVRQGARASTAAATR